MKLIDARKLRMTIRELMPDHGFGVVVPFGHGPDGYFVRLSFKVEGKLHEIEFDSAAEWEEFYADFKAADERLGKLVERTKQAMADAETRPLTPIDRMIDKATGFKG